MRLTIPLAACIFIASTITPVVAKQNMYVVAKQHMDACEAGIKTLIDRPSRTGPANEAEHKLIMDTLNQCIDATDAVPHNPYLDADLGTFYLIMGHGSTSGNQWFHEHGEGIMRIAYREAIHAGDILTQDHACKVANVFYANEGDATCTKALVDRLDGQIAAVLDDMRAENERAEADDAAMNQRSLEFYEANRWWQDRR